MRPDCKCSVSTDELSELADICYRLVRRASEVAKRDPYAAIVLGQIAERGREADRLVCQMFAANKKYRKPLE